MSTPSQFQCPNCRFDLLPDIGICLGCGTRYATDDGILDFVGGRFDTQLDVASYDDYHTINDTSAITQYQHIRSVAGERWPASLGSVVEIGCGTGSFSRAMISQHDATDAVLTDVSVGMLQLCRQHLSRLDLASALSLRFATYSAHEACFRDESFDTCVGSSVVHHITDVRTFLANVWHMLRPGGRALFLEPTFRFMYLMAMTFADIIAFLLSRSAEFSLDRQMLHNWVAEARRGAMLHGDLEILATYEDKHMFLGEEFEAMALDAGFATAEALPSSPDPDGLGAIGGLMTRLQIGEPLAGTVKRLWPSYVSRHMPLLNARDRSPGYLLWLTKGDTRNAPRHPQHIERPEPVLSSEAEITGDGLPLRFVLSLLPEPHSEGVRLKIGGWCVANADIKAVRVTVGGVTQCAPVWLPRADVHLTVNPDRAYSPWNSLCCGVDSELVFERPNLALTLEVDLLFRDNRYTQVVTNAHIAMGMSITVGQ